MKLLKTHPVKCHGCRFQCNMTDTNNLRLLNCLESQYIIWPAGNFYLEKGVTTLLKDTYYNIHSGGFVFVDFTHYHLSIFCNDDWLQLLKKIPMNIILLSEHTLEPLAYFWMHHDRQITDVLPIRKYRPFSLLKHTNASFERHNQKVPKATKMEMKVLDLLIANLTVRDVASRMNITPKSVYNLQYSLERKIGISLKELIIR